MKRTGREEGESLNNDRGLNEEEPGREREQVQLTTLVFHFGADWVEPGSNLDGRTATALNGV